MSQRRFLANSFPFRTHSNKASKRVDLTSIYLSSSTAFTSISNRISSHTKWNVGNTDKNNNIFQENLDCNRLYSRSISLSVTLSASDSNSSDKNGEKESKSMSKVKSTGRQKKNVNGQSKQANNKTSSSMKSSSTSRRNMHSQDQKEEREIKIIKDYPPKEWSEQYERILLMRSQYVAEVDEYGCAAIGQHLSDGDQKILRLRTLISSLFSSQTKDKVNAIAMQRLTTLCPNNQMTVEHLEKLKEYEIVEAIRGVSFHNTKATNLIKIIGILQSEYQGDIPKTYKELLTLPGIGPKMAHLVMTHAIGETVGICVDTHVHRISHRLGWVNNWQCVEKEGNPPTKGGNTPEKTRKDLESWVPKEKWGQVNDLLVGFGQTICSAYAPQCERSCIVKDICPFYQNVYAKANSSKYKIISNKIEKVNVTDSARPGNPPDKPSKLPVSNSSRGKGNLTKKDIDINSTESARGKSALVIISKRSEPNSQKIISSFVDEDENNP